MYDVTRESVIQLNGYTVVVHFTTGLNREPSWRMWCALQCILPRRGDWMYRHHVKRRTESPRIVGVLADHYELVGTS